MTAKKVANKASMINQATHLNSLSGLSPSVGIPSAVRMVYKCGGPTDSCKMPADAVGGTTWLKTYGVYNVRKTNGGIGRTAGIVHQNCCSAGTASPT